MTTVEQVKQWVPFSAAQMFDLVLDVEHYPLFLPAVKAARIIDRGDDVMTADMVIAAGPLRESFRSHVTHERPRRIRATLAGGTLRSLATEWLFTPCDDSTSFATIEVVFASRSRVRAAIVRQMTRTAVPRIAAAIVSRAGAIYGHHARSLRAPGGDERASWA